VKIPRDIGASRLIQSLRVLGYEVTRQNGSHIRITTEREGQHHEVIPNHSPIKIGTISSILKNIAAHHRLTLEELLQQLDL